MGSRRGVYWVSVGELEDQRALGRGRLVWDGIMYCKEMGLFLDWFSLTQDRNRWRAFVNAMTNLLFP